MRTWEKQGLIAPVEEYGFSHMRTLRTLNALRRQRIPASKIRASVESLKVRLGDVQNPLDQVKMFADGKRISVQYGGVRLDPVSGQLLLDFETKPDAPRLLATRHEPERNREQSDFWFQKGLELEQASGKTDEAIEAYKKAIELNPNAAGAFVNLGTIYFHKRDWAHSEKFYAGAIAADPNYALAHYNLGNLYDERNNSEKAYEHYHIALKLQPHYADAHYNLALLHQGQGDMMRALSHWQTYLKLDPASQWSGIARREIEKIKQSTIVGGTKTQRA